MGGKRRNHEELLKTTIMQSYLVDTMSVTGVSPYCLSFSVAKSIKTLV